MAVGRMPVLRVGEWVHFDGEEHQVVALAGTSVRLHSRSGAAQVVLLTFLLAAADFELVDVPAMPAPIRVLSRRSAPSWTRKPMPRPARGTG